MAQNKYLLSPRRFFQRVFTYTFFALSLLSVSLLIGIVGYRYIADLNWTDSFYNAAMILTGMGPVDKMITPYAKVFSSLYALFSGVVFLSTVAIFFAPFAHRLMHLLHVDSHDQD